MYIKEDLFDDKERNGERQKERENNKARARENEEKTESWRWEEEKRGGRGVSRVISGRQYQVNYSVLGNFLSVSQQSMWQNSKLAILLTFFFYLNQPL